MQTSTHTYSFRFLYVVCALFLTLFTSCRDKRISYVEMLNRERNEINSFLSQEGIQIVKEFPKELVTPEKVFVEIEDGLYIRVIKAGTTKPTVGQTIILTRLKSRSLAPDRFKFSYDNISPDMAAGTDPIGFVYQDNRDYLRPDYTATAAEQEHFALFCSALLEAMMHVGDGAEVQVITSFKFGPSFASEQGVPLFFERVSFNFKPGQ